MQDKDSGEHAIELSKHSQQLSAFGKAPKDCSGNWHHGVVKEWHGFAAHASTREYACPLCCFSLPQILVLCLSFMVDVARILR